MVDDARNSLVTHIVLPRCPILDLIRHTGGRQLLVQHGSIGSITSIQPIPSWRASGNRQKGGILRHYSIDNRPNAVLTRDANVHVGSPQQHLLSPAQSAVNDRRIGFFFRYSMLPKVRKGVAARTPHANIVRSRHTLYRANTSGELSDCLRKGTTNAGD